MLQMQHPLGQEEGRDHRQQQSGGADAGDGHGDHADAALRALAASDDGASGASDDHERQAVFPPVTELLAGGDTDVADVRASGAAMRLPVVGSASRQTSDSNAPADPHAPALAQPGDAAPATAAIPPARLRAAPPVPVTAVPTVPIRTSSSDHLSPEADAAPAASAASVAAAAALPSAPSSGAVSAPIDTGSSTAVAATGSAAAAPPLQQPAGAAAQLQAELAQAAAAAGGNLAPGDGHVVVLLSSLRANAEMQAVSVMNADCRFEAA